MSKGIQPPIDAANAGTDDSESVDATLESLQEKAARLLDSDEGPRSGRWPANDYY